MSKPPGNSTLGTLPKEIQEALFQRMSFKQADGRPATTKEALAWLKAEHGVTISQGRANAWYSSYLQTRVVREADDAAEKFQEWAKNQLPGMSAADIADMGQRAFLAIALRDSNPELFATFLNTFAKMERLQLDREKLKLAEAKLEACRQIAESGDAAETVATKLAKLFAPAA